MLSENFEKINVSYPVHLLLCKNGIERTRIPENFGTGTEMEPKRNQNRNRKNPKPKMLESFAKICQNSENQKSDLIVLGCHTLTSRSTASYHTYNERGDSGLSYEPKL